eukprot:CAMPEP_0182872274 /NCGR_PEP_ID=MMETSP0034_2-20130328/11608_1 /TAXON_ID=156128 /ORGANISM="Nephroselmis pyriformis, Strain CCMP717" /LENGTH=188 /DNA_ID=CAMNT_0025004859 /DNA_START=125 /DNA_END=691 /DNA_ORIENTATION=+
MSHITSDIACLSILENESPSKADDVPRLTICPRHPSIPGCASSIVGGALTRRLGSSPISPTSTNFGSFTRGDDIESRGPFPDFGGAWPEGLTTRRSGLDALVSGIASLGPSSASPYTTARRPGPTPAKSSLQMAVLFAASASCPAVDMAGISTSKASEDLSRGVSVPVFIITHTFLFSTSIALAGRGG